MKKEFTIFQPKIFSYLRHGKTLSNGVAVPADEFFITSISLIAGAIAREIYGCNVVMNPDNLASARRYWCRDISNIAIRRKQEEEETGKNVSKPSAEKHAAFLAYWLRRRLVVQSVTIAQKATNDNTQYYQNRFLKDSSETIAFVIGLYLCVQKRYSPDIAAF
jgi:hypothetical protein